MPTIAHGQEDLLGGFEKRKDKAVAELKAYPQQDTARINALVRVMKTASFLKQQQAVKPYYEEALTASRKLNYARGLAECYRYMGNLYKSSANHPGAQLYFDSVILVCRNADDSALLELRAMAQRWKGLIYFEQENYYEALANFFEALKYYDYYPGQVTMYICTDIAAIYINLNNLEQASVYAVKAIGIAEKDFPWAFRAGAYLTMVDICIRKNELHLGSYYLDKIKPYMPDSIEASVNVGYYEGRGRINYLQYQCDSAFYYYQRAYTYATHNMHNSDISTSLNFLTILALKLDKLEMARKYAEENMALTEQTDAKADKINALLNLAAYYHKTGEDNKAYELMRHAVDLKDSLTSETNLKQADKLSAIYEADKKQKEIFQLQNDKQVQAAAVRHKSALNVIFIFTISGLLVFGYLAFQHFKDGQKIAYQQQKLQQQKISELEKDRQLVSVDAMLKGQEEERSRIAKDLHDGLGGMLSGLKLSLLNIKEKSNLPPGQLTIFERSVVLLDNTIAELRKVAHNLMPEILVRFGIDEALKEYCCSIQSSSGINVVYQQFGKQRKLGRQAEINIYRIVQELVNNALKHAGATQILVQLTREHGKTSLTVEDDGRGFDDKLIWKKKGAGFSNIKYRVDYFKGSLDIISGPGNGTSVNMQLIA